MGWIYVLLNSSIPGVCKVGRTDRTPEERAVELSSSTGVVRPYLVAYKQEFTDSVSAEKKIHDYFESLGWRVSKNREFFEGDVSEVIRYIVKLEDNSLIGKPSTNRIDTQHAYKAFYTKAEDCRLGKNGEVINLTKAKSLYQKAINLGCPYSCRRLAELKYPKLKSKQIELLEEGLSREKDAYGCLQQLKLIYADSQLFEKSLSMGEALTSLSKYTEKSIVELALFLCELESYGLIPKKVVNQYRSGLLKQKGVIEEFFINVDLSKLSKSSQRFYYGLVRSIGLLVDSAEIINKGSNPTLKGIFAIEKNQRDFEPLWGVHYKKLNTTRSKG